MYVNIHSKINPVIWGVEKLFPNKVNMGQIMKSPNTQSNPIQSSYSFLVAEEQVVFHFDYPTKRERERERETKKQRKRYLSSLV
jgi:hypothetical protein